MAFFEQFGNKINQGINQVTSKTRDYTDQMKLDSEIKNMEKTLNGCYTELGRIYYERKREIYAGDLNTEEEIIIQIDAIRQMIQTKRKDKVELKNKILCPECGKTVPEDTKFCPYCGTAMVKPISEAFSVSDTHSVCPKCGEQLEEEALFCTACGTRIVHTEPEDKQTSENAE